MSLLSKKTDTDSIKHEERLVRVKIRDTFFFTFQIFRYNDIIKCPSMKHKTHLTEELRTKHSLVMTFGQFM